jgi:hypothetical protein
LNVISILNTAALALGQQHLYIIAHNALPPVDPYIVDKPTIDAMHRGSALVKEQAAKLKYLKERIFAGNIQVSAGGILDFNAAGMILGALSTDPNDIEGQAAISAEILTGLIKSEVGFLVCHGASVSGTGTVQGKTVLCEGTVAPGTSIGRLTIDGDLLVEAGRLEIEIGGSAPGQFDMLAVTGSAEFQGGTIRVVFTGGFVPTEDDAIEFLTAEGGVVFDPARTALEVVGAEPGTTFVVVASAGGLVLQRRETSDPEPPEPDTLTALSPAQVWVGLKNSDAVGLRLDPEGRSIPQRD